MITICWVSKHSFPVFRFTPGSYLVRTDTFLPFDLEFACSASSVLIMVDEVLRGQKIADTTKSLIPKVLNEMAEGGNKTAPSRQRELQQLSYLAHRLWEDIEARERTSPAQDHSVSLNGLDAGEQQDRVAANLPDGQPLLPNTGYLNGPSQQDDASLIMPPMSTTSSADFAQTFDFSQEQMLFLVDHLDDDTLPSMLDFGNHGLDEWL
jgi:hypothetical protein